MYISNIKLLQSMLIVTLFLMVAGCSTSTCDDTETKIDKLIKSMTLEQKIGQMTQLSIDLITTGGPSATLFPLELDEAIMDTVFAKYYVGSILNAPSTTALTAPQWCSVIKKIQQKALLNGEIPMLYGLDQIHGTSYTAGGTLFPQQIGMAATFNPELVKQSAEITAYETKASAVPWTFTPVLDLGRDARWSRQWETYGEDSYLASVMGVAAIEGFQGGSNDNIGHNYIASCLKHYMGYGSPQSGKDRTPSYISKQDMRERHFAPFLSAIRSGALTVMVNSGINNGLPVHANYELITQWLKEDLNWDGMVVTDWADINNLFTRDKIVESKKEAIKLAINAGIDMAMVPYEWSFCNYLKELVEEGEVKMSRIDDATRRVLRLKFRLGLFDKPYYDYSEFPKFASDEFAQVALKSAQESITLLANKDNVLPIAKGKKILVAGPNANSMRPLNGGWSYSWQGDKAHLDSFTGQYNTILEAFQTKYGISNVFYSPGVEYDFEGHWSAEKKPQIAAAVAAAQSVDYIVLCVGENSYCETPGNLDDLTISKNQLDLAEALAATGKPVIMVLGEGRPRIIADIEPLMAAIVHTYLPGNYGADALVDVLVGDVNPSGKLPYTYPKYPNSLITYDYKPSQQLDQMEGSYNYDAIVSVQWAFGYGLSYTEFEYSNLRVDKNEFTADDVLKFTVDVRNSGKVDGKEVVMLFSSDDFASLTPDTRRLRAFSKVAIKAGETKKVTLEVPAYSLAFVGYDGKWILEKGSFTIQVGNQTLKTYCKTTNKWDSHNII